ncbi:MAG: methyltransferase family protein [Chthoniobacterales bacterium]
MKALSIIGYLVILAGLFGLYRVGSAFASKPLFVALQVAAVALMIWARLTFGLRSFHPAANPTAGGLVTSGPYRRVRHPIYSSICLFALAGLINRFSPLALVFFTIVVAGAIIRLACEERLLRLTYPEYAQYSNRTYRLVPGIF